MASSEKPERRVCPACGRGRLARVVYGRAAPTGELKRALEEGEAVLGGCVPGAARWRCPECDAAYPELPAR